MPLFSPLKRLLFPSSSPLSSPTTPWLPVSFFGSTPETKYYTKLTSLSPSTLEIAQVESFPTAERTKRPFRLDPRLISDAIIGLSDGLTVPFALTAGLTALGSTRIVVTGGMAELIAGAISMGLGGYLGARSEEDSYQATMKQTHSELASISPSSANEYISTSIASILSPYDIPASTLVDLTTHLSTSPHLAHFLVHFRQPDSPNPLYSPTTSSSPSRSAVAAALTIAAGYFLGGFIPLLPYLFVEPHAVSRALGWSVAVMVVTLFVFGYVKTGIVEGSGWAGEGSIRACCFGGVQMVAVGGVAAGASMGIIRALGFEGG